MVNEETHKGDIIYLRFDPGARETTAWSDSCMAAFNDARAALAAVLQTPLPTRSGFYAIDWQRVTTKSNVYIEGRSLTLAAALAMASYYCQIPLGHVLCTGDLAQDGRVLPIDRDGMKLKLQFLNAPSAGAFSELVIPGDGGESEIHMARIKVHCVKTLRQTLEQIAASYPLEINLPDTALSSDPQDAALLAASLLNRARVDLRGNDPAAAIDKCDRILNLDSRNAEAWYLKGVACLRTQCTEMDLPLALLPIAVRWDRPLDHQDRNRTVTARACLQEAARLSSECRDRLAGGVSRALSIASYECAGKVKDSLPAAGRPGHLETLQKMVMEMAAVGSILSTQGSWFSSGQEFDALVRNWTEACDKAADRLKQIRAVERDVRVDLALSRLAALRPSSPGHFWRGLLYAGFTALALLIVALDPDFFLPVEFILPAVTAILAIAILSAGWHLLTYQPPRSVRRLLDALWAKHAKKRGIEPVEAAEESLETACAQVESLAARLR